jgi:hypothetical protein
MKGFSFRSTVHLNLQINPSRFYSFPNASKFFALSSPFGLARSWMDALKRGNAEGAGYGRIKALFKNQFLSMHSFP